MRASRFLAVLLSTLSILSGCASGDFGSPDVYQRSDVQRPGGLQEATVIRVRPISIEASSDNSGITSLISAAAGAFLGSQTIGQGRGRYIAAAVAGAGTGVIAQKVSAVMSTRSGLEIGVRTLSGQILVIAQPADQQFSLGERVLLISTNSGLRVTH